MDLCTKLLIPPLLSNSPFDFVPHLPPRVTPPVATQEFLPTLITTLSPSPEVLAVSMNYLYTMQQPLKKRLPAHLLCMSLLLFFLPSADRKKPFPFPSAVPSIHHIPQDTSIPVPSHSCILSLMNETFDAILYSNNSLESRTFMSRHCELSH